MLIDCGAVRTDDFSFTAHIKKNMWVIMRWAGAHALKFTDTDTNARYSGIIAKMWDCVSGHGFSSNLLRHLNAR